MLCDCEIIIIALLRMLVRLGRSKQKQKQNISAAGNICRKNKQVVTVQSESLIRKGEGDVDIPFSIFHYSSIQEQRY